MQHNRLLIFKPYSFLQKITIQISIQTLILNFNEKNNYLGHKPWFSKAYNGLRLKKIVNYLKTQEVASFRYYPNPSDKSSLTKFPLVSLAADHIDLLLKNSRNFSKTVFLPLITDDEIISTSKETAEVFDSDFTLKPLANLAVPFIFIMLFRVKQNLKHCQKLDMKKFSLPLNCIRVLCSQFCFYCYLSLANFLIQ